MRDLHCCKHELNLTRSYVLGCIAFCDTVVRHSKRKAERIEYQHKRAAF